ncbi:Uncharacterised protein [Actinobacillus equuli]|nr:Uncharacterised protein [Actinobacillus equuli]
MTARNLQAIADKDVLIQGRNNVTLTADTNYFKETHFEKNRNQVHLAAVD